MQNVLKKELVMDNSHSFLLSDLPFQTGEKLLVFIMPEKDLQNNIQQWQALFKETQALRQVKAISETDIATEIEAYRSGL